MCYCFMYFVAVYYSCYFLCDCCLIGHCECEFCLSSSGFQSVLECYLEDLSLCVCHTDPRGIGQLLSVLASHVFCP